MLQRLIRLLKEAYLQRICIRNSCPVLKNEDKPAKKIISLFLFIAIILFLGIFAFFNQPGFGKNPEGKRLETIRQLKNYVNGKFRNQEETPLFTSDDSVISVILKGLVT